MGDFHVGPLALPAGRFTVLFGQTGSGKTNLLSLLWRQTAARPGYAVFIDRHGDAAEDALLWNATRGRDAARRTVYLEPGRDDFTFGFDPFAGVRTGADLDEAVELAEAVLIAPLGESSTEQKPRLKRWLRNLLVAAHASGTPLADWPSLTAGVPGLPPDVAADFQGLAALRPRERETLLEAPVNRLRAAVNESTRPVFAGGPSVDFDAVVDGGQLVVVNLRGLTDDAASLLGSLFVIGLLRCVRRRGVDARSAGTLVVDEAALFVSRQLIRVFQETRKFGLTATLAFQSLSGLRRGDADLTGAALNNAGVLGTFQVKQERDLRQLAVALGYPNLDFTPLVAERAAADGTPRAEPTGRLRLGVNDQLARMQQQISSLPTGWAVLRAGNRPATPVRVPLLDPAVPGATAYVAELTEATKLLHLDRWPFQRPRPPASGPSWTCSPSTPPPSSSSSSSASSRVTSLERGGF